ncbi:MAG: hypothetical protein HY059_21740 [Proteobacteria bacterium]|nr:hypothetical protein [Pseudomonadota bacterium]
MRRIFALIALLLAGCVPDPGPSLTAELAGGGRRIEIRARDTLPLVAARLRLPDGARIEAERVAGPPTEGRPLFGVGVSGGSSSGIDTGIGVSVPLGGLRAGGLVDSSARIWVPDPAAWPTLAPRARLELEFGRAPGETRRLEMPAPGR